MSCILLHKNLHPQVLVKTLTSSLLDSVGQEFSRGHSRELVSALQCLGPQLEALEAGNRNPCKVSVNYVLTVDEVLD